MSTEAKDITELTRDIINIFAEETKADNYITPSVAKKTYRELYNFLFKRLGANPSTEDMFRQLFSMQDQYDERAQENLLEETLLGKYYPSIVVDAILKLQQKKSKGDRKATFKDLPKETRLVLLMSAIIGEAKETQEALGLLPEYGAKWWKKNINWPLVKEELMDQLHFLLSAFLSAEMTPEEVFREYHDKWLINFQRQDNNY